MPLSKCSVGVLLLSGVLLAGCGESESLGGNYYLTDVDDEHAYISNGNRVVVDQFVVDFHRNGDFLFVLRKIANSIDCYDDHNIPTIITHWSDESEYWVINVATETEIGPLREQDYLQLLAQRKLGLSKLSTPNDYRSNTAAYLSHITFCARIG